jgi:hypothetical protein
VEGCFGTGSAGYIIGGTPCSGIFIEPTGHCRDNIFPGDNESFACCCG